MSTVLVTGGSGFVGSHVVLQLVNAGHDVRTTVRSLKKEESVRAMLRTAGAARRRARGYRWKSHQIRRRLTYTTHPMTLTVNGRAHTVDVEPDTPLLWVLRDTLGLTGTKFGCGIAACGACTVIVNGRAVRSCTFPVSSADGATITTIEGLVRDGALHPVQQAWIDHQVPQCGYCQSGMIVAVAALLEQNPHPADEDIDAGITNICRCGTFVRVRKAIHAVASR